MSHAVLSPSSASRWLKCAPSAQLEAREPYSTSSYADEGTLAHRLAELIIQYKLGRILQKEYKKKVKEIEADELYTGEMADYCEGFAVYVLELFNSMASLDPVLYTEERVHLDKWVPSGFGTVDIQIIADGWLHIIDLKYGKGVPVFADDNAQLKLYALGAYEDMRSMYKIDNITMTIYQPRIDNVSSWQTTPEALNRWADEVLVPGAKLAFDGGGEFVPGDHCKFCKIKGKCKALATFNLELAKKAFADDVDPAILSPEDVAEILQKEKFFTDWLNAVVEYALDQAINHGASWPGMKLVEGRSIRQYIDEERVVSKLVKDGGLNSADLYNMKIKGITDMTKLLGKADFERLLADLIHKPPGKPVLVAESDKRPAFGAADRAKNAFVNE